MRGPHLAALVLLALLAFMALLVWWGLDVMEAELEHTRRETPKATPESPIELTGRAPATREDAVQPDGPESDDDEGDGYFQKPPTHGPVFEGTIVVEEIDGTLHDNESGELWLILQNANKRDITETFKVPVVDGRFRLRLRSDERRGEPAIFAINRLLLDGRPTAIRGVNEYGQIEIEKASELRAVWKAITELHVLDDRTSEHVQEVQVVSWINAEDLVGFGYVDPRQAFAVEGDSPIQVPGHMEPSMVNQRGNTVLVRAPGYEFTTVTLDLERGGEREVRLRPGGTVRFTLAHKGRLPRGQFTRPRLTFDPNALWLTGAAQYGGTQTWEVTNLRVGTWQAGALRNYSKIESSMQTIEVEAGKTTEVVVEVTSEAPLPHEVEMIRLDLEVFVPDEWDTEGMRILLNARQTQPRHATLENLERIDATTWLWSIDLPKRRWVANVSQTGLIKAVYDPKDPSVKPRLELPRPAVVEVRCVWKHDQSPADVTRLSWGPTTHDASMIWSPHGSFERGEDGVFRARIVPQEIRIYPRLDGHHTATRMDAALEPGRQEFVMELVELCRVMIELYDGDTRVPWFLWAEDENEVVPTFETRVADVELDEDTGAILVGPPGRWRFSIFPRGFEPVAPFELDLERGDNGVRRVQLRRK